MPIVSNKQLRKQALLEPHFRTTIMEPLDPSREGGKSSGGG